MRQSDSFTIGIVGHRYIQPQTIETFVRRSCFDILTAAQRHHQDLVALSALAAGADTIFAEIALALCIPLHIILPFEDYISDFPGEEARHNYLAINAAASHETKLPFATRSVEAYYAAMLLVVEDSDILLAAWDGQEAKGRGGTSDAVAHVKAKEHDWIHIDVSNMILHNHCKRNMHVSPV